MSGNWWFPWDVYVIPQQNGDLWYYDSRTLGAVYAWDAVNQVFVSPSGRFDIMATSANGTWQLTKKHGTVLHFNSSGFLDWERDRHGRQANFARDPQNRITTSTDYAGRVMTYAYNAQNYLASLADFSGRVTSFTYTPQGYLATLSYPSTTYYDRTTSATVTRGRTLAFQDRKSVV